MENQLVMAFLPCLNQNQAKARSKSKGQEAARAVTSILSL